MTTDHRNDSLRLDQLLASLPKDVAPSRDFWPDIRDAAQKPAMLPRRSLFAQLAAGFVLVAVTALITFGIMRQSMVDEAKQQALIAVESDAIAIEYLRARSELDQMFAQRVATLPPATRAKIEGDLADLRRAADELAATLSAHPTDPLLRDLLVSTRQRELQLLADISRMADPNS